MRQSGRVDGCRPRHTSASLDGLVVSYGSNWVVLRVLYHIIDCVRALDGHGETNHFEAVTCTCGDKAKMFPVRISDVLQLVVLHRLGESCWSTWVFLYLL